MDVDKDTVTDASSEYVCLSMLPSRIFEVLQQREAHETTVFLLDHATSTSQSGGFSWRRFGDCKRMSADLLPTRCECRQIFEMLLTPRWTLKDGEDVGQMPDFRLTHGFREVPCRPDLHEAAAVAAAVADASAAAAGDSTEDAVAAVADAADAVAAQGGTQQACATQSINMKKLSCFASIVM